MNAKLIDCLLGMTTKQYASIMEIVQACETLERHDLLVENITDTINYLLLLRVMVEMTTNEKR